MILFPEQPPFAEILEILGYKPEDVELYKHSLEHFIWGHVLRTHLKRLSDGEKQLLLEKIKQNPGDASIIPSEIARLQGADTMRETLESVSQHALNLSLTQLLHQIPADKSEHRVRLEALFAQLKPILIDITEWLKNNPVYQALFA